MEPPELGEANEIIRGGMFPHQRSWWELPNFVKVLVTGYGGGKTFTHCKRVIGSALYNAPCPVATVSPTFTIARETTIAGILDLLAGRSTLDPGLVWSYVGGSHPPHFEIRYHGRVARILVYSGDNPLSLRGPNLAAMYLDEPFIMEYEVMKQAVARVRHPRAKLLEIGLTGTPEQLNWGYDLCEGELREKYDVGVVQASTRANLALQESFAQRLEETYDARSVLAFVEGQFVNLQTGAVFYAFDRMENIVSIIDDQGAEDMPRGATLGVGMDFNVNPMAAAVFWRQGERMHFFEEIELPNADTEEMAKTLRDKYGDRLNTVYPDATGFRRQTSAPAGRTDFTILEDAGFEIDAPSVNPHRKDRWNSTNGHFKSSTGKVNLTISPKCKHMRKYLMLYTHVDMQKDEQKAMSHLLDAMSYPVHRLFPKDAKRAKQLRLRGT